MSHMTFTIYNSIAAKSESKWFLSSGTLPSIGVWKPNASFIIYEKEAKKKKEMQIVGIEGIYKVQLFQAIFPHHVDCKLIDGKEIYLKLNSHH